LKVAVTLKPLDTLNELSTNLLLSTQKIVLKSKKIFSFYDRGLARPHPEQKRTIILQLANCITPDATKTVEIEYRTSFNTEEQSA
jgi:hypothetical protein